MLFIYWGWDSAVSVNEETKDRDKTPGRAAVISTVLLLVTYVVVTHRRAVLRRRRRQGHRPGQPDNSGDIFGVSASRLRQSGGFGTMMAHLLILLVLTSAAASTQTTILPTARTTLSMAAYKRTAEGVRQDPPALPDAAVVDLAFGVRLGRALRGAELLRTNAGNVIADCVTALGMMIAFYYGLTGFACFWYYRKELTSSPRNFLMQGIMPLARRADPVLRAGLEPARRLGLGKPSDQLHVSLAHARSRRTGHRLAPSCSASARSWSASS